MGIKNLMKLTQRVSPESLRITDLSQLAEGSKTVKVAIDSSISGIVRIGEIVASMRRFSHREYDKEKHPADINQAVVDSLAVSRNQWKNFAEVKTELDPDLPHVSCLLGVI